MEDDRWDRLFERWWLHVMYSIAIYLVITGLLIGALIVGGVVVGVAWVTASPPIATPTGQCIYPVAVGRASTAFWLTLCSTQYPVPACVLERHTFLGTYRETAPCPRKD